MRLKIAVSVVRFRPWAPSAPPQPFATACRTSKPREKPYKLSDSGGLFLLIERKGSKLWRHAFRYDGKQKLVALGAYPWSSDRSRQFLGRPFILLSPVFIFVEAVGDIGGYGRVVGFSNSLAILLLSSLASLRISVGSHRWALGHHPLWLRVSRSVGVA